ncbi:hypothetical protein RRG08_005907 [Elysia crispata]|uniref:Uncharacterized protein n=1 Tax=Elysia crispata TaxID=231223 RepID=A0AAE1CT27_9GAST|nr:hypothetical protein RRG08_005907 [Elysia crispata]
MKYSYRESCTEEPIPDTGDCLAAINFDAPVNERNMIKSLGAWFYKKTLQPLAEESLCSIVWRPRCPLAFKRVLRSKFLVFP